MTNDELIKKYAKQCRHCLRKTLLPYEHELTCIPCGYNKLKQKNELPKIQRKRTNFINRFKNAEHKIFRLCIEAYKLKDGNHYDDIYKSLCKLKIKKIKIINILIRKVKDMCDNSDFEQNHSSRTTEGV